MELDHNELLEEMLRKGEQAVFPTVRKSVERFVSIINHDKVQRKINAKLQEFVKNKEELQDLIRRCEGASSVYEKLQLLRKLLKRSLDVADPWPIFRKLQCVGLMGLINGENFKFLVDDDLTLNNRVEKFLDYVETDETESVDENSRRQAFEDYIKSWKSNRQRNRCDNKSIEADEREMRREYDKAQKVNKLSYETSLNELRDEFEPLREVLLTVKKVENGAMLSLLAAGGACWLFPPLAPVLLPVAVGSVSTAAAAHTKIGNRDDKWFDSTATYLLDYLRGLKRDSELEDFISRESLEKDKHHFENRINPWLRKLSKKLEEFRPREFHISGDLVMKEVERMKAFLYAVVLNKPEMLREHQNLLLDMIQTAANHTASPGDAAMLPLISFGQLPLFNGLNQRIVSLKFVLDRSAVDTQQEEVLHKLCKLFHNVKMTKKYMDNGVNIIQLDICIDDNLPQKIARFISQLSDLKIRCVLVGEFGLGGFRHAMNPAYNRIYSLHGVDKAEGFMATYFPGSLDRGGEPYYCPNGWRRYSIDVGITGAEFERAYGNWHVAYHGTEGHIAMSILLNGIRASGHGCFIDNGEGAVYLSPSIEYSGHPRYAKVWEVKSKYVQMVLQVRVDRKLVFDKKQGTLPGAFPADKPMDKNFKDNMELEWVIKWPPGTHISAANGILIYGIMLRVTDEHPKKLPQNAWWQLKQA